MIGASGGSSFFLLLIIAFGVLWFVLIRPQKRRQLEAQQMLNKLDVGDEVVTAGGIYGEITAVVGDDDVMVRIAPGLEVKVARRAIGGVVRPEEDEEEEQPDLEEEPKDEPAAGPAAPADE